MQLVRYSNTVNGPYIVLDQDCWIRYGIEHVDLINTTELKKFNQLLHYAKSIRPHARSVIDGGLNMGSWSIPLAKQHADLQFHAFEVQRMMYYIACGNIALNNVLNVRAYLMGLDQQPGTLDIPVPDYSQSGNFGAYEVHKPYRGSDCALEFTAAVDPIATNTIDSMNLDTLLIKLDIEGMEYCALQGATNTINCHEPVVWCESNKSDPQCVVEFFNSRGYCMTTAIDGHWLFLPKWIDTNIVENLIN